MILLDPMFDLPRMEAWRSRDQRRSGRGRPRPVIYAERTSEVRAWPAITLLRELGSAKGRCFVEAARGRRAATLNLISADGRSALPRSRWLPVAKERSYDTMRDDDVSGASACATSSCFPT